MITAIHQFLPVFARHDAIGETVLEIQRTLREWGYESEIFVEKPLEQTSKISKKFTEYQKQTSDMIIYHHSIASALSDFTCSLDIPKLLFYHNITQPHFFEKYDKSIATECFLGRKQLEQLTKYFKYAMGVSEYTRNELVSLNFKNVLPMQYFINLERFSDMKSKPEIVEKYKDKTNVIFVGRRSPNKKIDDILKTFAYYQIFNPNSRLFILGGSWAVASYERELQELAKILRIEDFVFINSLTDEELASYYRIADVFLCMSEHEGFCVPLVESMYFEVPIVAYNSTAIPDTLGGTGILVNHKKYDEIAMILDMITSDDALAKTITSKQKERLKFYNNKNASEILRKNIDLIISETSSQS